MTRLSALGEFDRQEHVEPGPLAQAGGHVIYKADAERLSPLVLARIAGIASLIGIVTGAFDIGYVRSTLIVSGDAAATIHNVLAHETMFRLGCAGHMVLLLCNVVAEIITFVLFRRVNVVLAAIAAACGLIGTAIESLDMAAAYVPLKLAAEGGALGAFSPQQLQGFSYVALQLQDTGLLISFVFYGLDEMLVGFLVFRSRVLPRIVAVLLGVSGFCYLVDGFTSFIAPTLQNHLLPYLLFPCLPGEALFGIWMAIVGLNTTRWNGAPASMLLGSGATSWSKNQR